MQMQINMFRSSLGLPVPREAVPRLGFISGTQDNNCICIKSEDEEDEVRAFQCKGERFLQTRVLIGQAEELSSSDWTRAAKLYLLSNQRSSL